MDVSARGSSPAAKLRGYTDICCSVRASLNVVFAAKFLRDYHFANQRRLQRGLCAA
jgi:hypothetical protein